eukprot:CAMPEP_0181097460 /NCGR_PEP_ID=MMETSP1071-20121207/11580_1 /TAXON_ID=35127 /ORGANISM="Thalassiosira sp., Strain NH16" /LENGTH=372 /DNA_ID=CAMNT_0023179941 /DNA_START=429 /DNA_END=1547 /DNA_ORIENTATION=-
MVHHNLASGACIPLSPDQSHYLINVMRILKKGNRRNQQSATKDIDGITVGRDCIRIFNGENGEWLAKVRISSQEQNKSSNHEEGRSTKRGRSSKHSDRISLMAECIFQLRPQDLIDDKRPSIMFVPLKKQPRMKLMVEKCTELGVGKLIPVTSDHMEGGASMALLASKSNESDLDVIYGGHGRTGDIEKVRIDKLELQSIEASEQCERLGIPTITIDVGLAQHESSQCALWSVQDLVRQWCYEWEDNHHLNEDRDLEDLVERAQVDSARLTQAGSRVLLICRERVSGEVADEGRVKTVPVLQALRDNQHVSFLVGPEGGWSNEEEEMFDEICCKYSGNDTPVKCISLGSSVLRAETACMLAVGAWALVHDSQ